MSVEIISTKDRVTAFLSGEIDHHTAAAMREEIDKAIAFNQPKMLKLDYSGVTFMDSSGVGLVMGRYRAMQPYGGQIIVANLSPSIYKVMRLAGIEKIAKITQADHDESKRA